MKKRVFATLAFLAMLPLYSSAQTAFRIELEAGGEVFSAGKNALLACDSTYNGVIRVISTSAGSGREFCASAVQLNTIEGNGKSRPMGKFMIKEPTMIEGGCSFPFIISTASGALSLEFSVYEEIDGKKVAQKVGLRDRYIGIKCK